MKTACRRTAMFVAFVVLFASALTAQERPAAKPAPAGKQDEPAKANTDKPGKAEAAQSPKADAVKPEKIYDEQADAKKLVESALAKARRDNTRVLVMYGGNWCGWCHKLHGLFKADKEIAHTLLYEYQLVMVDIGKWDKNMELAQSYGADLKKTGVPLLTVLDADGKVLINQDTGALEAGEKHDPDKVQSFLDKWKATPRDAQEVLKKAQERAAAAGKKLFLHFGAPWCGWCHKLEDFMAAPEIAAILEKDFVDLKIDMDRMPHAQEVATKFHKPERGGIPWFAFVDAAGAALATSDGPKGNIGFPAAEDEIGHFVGMLTKVRKNMTEQDVARIDKALRDAAAAAREKASPR